MLQSYKGLTKCAIYSTPLSLKMGRRRKNRRLNDRGDRAGMQEARGLNWEPSPMGGTVRLWGDQFCLKGKLALK